MPKSKAGFRFFLYAGYTNGLRRSGSFIHSRSTCFIPKLTKLFFYLVTNKGSYSSSPSPTGFSLSAKVVWIFYSGASLFMNPCKLVLIPWNEFLSKCSGAFDGRFIMFRLKLCAYQCAKLNFVTAQRFCCSYRDRVGGWERKRSRRRARTAFKLASFRSSIALT